MMKLSELQISELETWLADGPDIDEIVERFAKLEQALDKWKRLAEHGLWLYRQTRYAYGDDPVVVHERVVELLEAKER